MSISPINSGRTESFRENHSALVTALLDYADIWTYSVPSKCRLRFKSFGNYLGTVAAWGFCTWTVLLNNVPIWFYGGNPAVLDQVGYAAQRQQMTEYEVGGGTQIRVQGYNPTAADVNMGISIEYELIYQE